MLSLRTGMARGHLVDPALGSPGPSIASVGAGLATGRANGALHLRRVVGEICLLPVYRIRNSSGDPSQSCVQLRRGQVAHSRHCCGRLGLRNIWWSGRAGLFCNGRSSTSTARGHFVAAATAGVQFGHIGGTPGASSTFSASTLLLTRSLRCCATCPASRGALFLGRTSGRSCPLRLSRFRACRGTCSGPSFRIALSWLLARWSPLGRLTILSVLFGIWTGAFSTRALLSLGRMRISRWTGSGCSTGGPGCCIGCRSSRRCLRGYLLRRPCLCRVVITLGSGGIFALRLLIFVLGYFLVGFCLFLVGLLLFLLELIAFLCLSLGSRGCATAFARGLPTRTFPSSSRGRRSRTLRARTSLFSGF